MFYEKYRKYKKIFIIKKPLDDSLLKSLDKSHILLSSMKENDWNPLMNQMMILDTIFDKNNTTILKNFDDYFGIINGVIVLIMYGPIHDRKGKIDWKDVIENMGFRVTRNEICFTSKILNDYYKNSYKIEPYQIKDNWWGYIFHPGNMDKENI